MDIKEHFKKYKTWYLCGVTGVTVAGITCIIMRRNCFGMQSVTKPEMQSVTGKISSLSFFSSTTNTNIVSVVEKETRGHPGYLVRHIESGEVYKNQGNAARAFDAYPSIMSQHLRGLRPDVNGEHFERINLN